jgi:hypothetical protein
MYDFFPRQSKEVPQYIDQGAKLEPGSSKTQTHIQRDRDKKTIDFTSHAIVQE